MKKVPLAGVAADAREWFGGAFGAGLVLILLPCFALYFGIRSFAEVPGVGLPVLAIFGILILLGALALVATLFQRLGLSDASQALALPEGSIRAAIAMALIVLFAIISIMLYQSLSDPSKRYEIGPLTVNQKDELLRESLSNKLTDYLQAVIPGCVDDEGEPVSGDCDAAHTRYKILLRESQTREAADLAKQLLVLIGTLMTSLTSFYFASRVSEAAVEAAATADGSAGGGAVDYAGGANPDIDGCDVAITEPTADEELPASTGGVA